MIGERERERRKGRSSTSNVYSKALHAGSGAKGTHILYWKINNTILLSRIMANLLADPPSAAALFVVPEKAKTEMSR